MVRDYERLSANELDSKLNFFNISIGDRLIFSITLDACLIAFNITIMIYFLRTILFFLIALFALQAYAKDRSAAVYDISKCDPVWPVGGAQVRVFLKDRGIELESQDSVVSSVASTSVIITASKQTHQKIAMFIEVSKKRFRSTSG